MRGKISALKNLYTCKQGLGWSEHLRLQVNCGIDSLSGSSFESAGYFINLTHERKPIAAQVGNQFEEIQHYSIIFVVNGLKHAKPQAWSLSQNTWGSMQYLSW